MLSLSFTQTPLLERKEYKDLVEKTLVLSSAQTTGRPVAQHWRYLKSGEGKIGSVRGNAEAWSTSTAPLGRSAVHGSVGL